MNQITQSFVFLALTSIAVVIAAQQGFLGPYGQPGDNLHLILLVAVLFFTYLIFVYTVYRSEN